MRANKKRLSLNKNNRGFTLLEVLIGISVGTAFSLMFMGFIANQTQKLTHAEAKEEASDVVAEIKDTISNTQICTNSFQGKTVEDHVQELFRMRDGQREVLVEGSVEVDRDGDGETDIRRNIVATRLVEFKEMNILRIRQAAIGHKVDVEVILTKKVNKSVDVERTRNDGEVVERQRNVTKNKTIRKKISFFANLDENNRIISCIGPSLEGSVAGTCSQLGGIVNRRGKCEFNTHKLKDMIDRLITSQIRISEELAQLEKKVNINTLAQLENGRSKCTLLGGNWDNRNNVCNNLAYSGRACEALGGDHNANNGNCGKISKKVCKFLGGRWDRNDNQCLYDNDSDSEQEDDDEPVEVASNH